MYFYGIKEKREGEETHSFSSDTIFRQKIKRDYNIIILICVA